MQDAGALRAPARTKVFLEIGLWYFDDVFVNFLSDFDILGATISYPLDMSTEGSKKICFCSSWAKIHLPEVLGESPGESPAGNPGARKGEHT